MFYPLLHTREMVCNLAVAQDEGIVNLGRAKIRRNRCLEQDGILGLNEPIG